MADESHDGAASAALIATVSSLLDPLEARLKPLDRVCVAFSGGVDSSVVLAVATRVLGAGRVLAFTAVSETYRDDELAAARAFAESLGVRHLTWQTRELDDQRFVANTPRPLLLLQVDAARGHGAGCGRRRHRGPGRRRQPRRSGRRAARPARLGRARRAPPADRGRARQGGRARPRPGPRPACLEQARRSLSGLAHRLRRAGHRRQAAPGGRRRRRAARARSGARAAGAPPRRHRPYRAARRCRRSGPPRPTCATPVDAPPARPGLYLRRPRPAGFSLGQHERSARAAKGAGK